MSWEVSNLFVLNLWCGCQASYSDVCSLLICEEAAGAPTSADKANDDLPLDRVVSDLGVVCTHAKDALAKSASTLGAVYKTVLPSGEVPTTADGFADVFGSETSTMANFARALSVRGSESTLKLLLGHGLEGDYEKALSDFPRRPDGKPVPLKGVSAPAARLAETFMTTMERRAKEVATRLLRGKSESTS